MISVHAARVTFGGLGRLAADARLTAVSKWMRSALVLLAAGGACLLALIGGGSWGPCGPSSILGLIGLAGMLICFPLACLILLACGLRTLVHGPRGGPEGIA